ncbi:MAG TPA: two-component regulator propeller domain-containing protein [Chitinophagales bacterium]|nr:two-component regulator propeller domain-containing protein [Chitinophagales bacterium]
MQRRVLFALLFISLETRGSFAQPQQIQFQHLTVANGLSDNRTTDITQDKFGFIWIGTQEGLNRYDGYHIEVFRHKANDTTSLPSNLINCLFTDSKGTLWIGTDKGLAQFDYGKNNFIVFHHDSTDESSLADDYIQSVDEDGNGNIFIGTQRGLSRFNSAQHHFKSFRHNSNTNSISGSHVNDIATDTIGNLWLATTEGLSYFDVKTFQFTNYHHDSTSASSISNDRLRFIAIDKQGNIWLDNEAHVIDRMDPVSKTCHHYPQLAEKLSGYGNPYLNDFFCDRSGKIWIATGVGGCALWIAGADSFQTFMNDLLLPASISSNTCRKIFQDRSGVIWIASALSGAERFNPVAIKFESYQQLSLQIPTLMNKWVRAVAEDSLKRLWIATGKGISVYDRVKKSYTNYIHDPGNSLSIAENSVRSVCCDKNGTMWVGTGNGLSCYDASHNHFRNYFNDHSDTRLPGNYIWSMMTSSEGDLWIGSSGGLCKYNYATDDFTNFKGDSAHDYLNNIPKDIIEDHLHNLWIGFLEAGVARYNPATGEMKIWRNNANDPSSLASDNINALAEDLNHNLWIATNNGLCVYDEGKNSFRTYTMKDGLPSDHVGSLLMDDKNNLWISTNNGICLFDSSRKTFRLFDEGDGIQNMEFNDQRGFVTSDGYFCFPNYNGWYMIHPDSFRINQFRPPVFVRGFKVFDEEKNIDSILSDNKAIQLSYKQNFFTFEFAALSFDHPEKNQYACELVGFDKKMNQLGANRFASYTNVPPGTYTLKVMASNNDSVWNETAYEMQLIITPPFWQTWWFRTLVVTSLVCAVFLFFRLREARIKKEEERKTAVNKRIAEIRMTALRSQMNPHFIFNSLNSIQHFITTKEKEEALNYLSKFSKLIRQILENSRENTVSIANELQLLQLYVQLEQLRFSNKFTYHLHTDEELDIENTEIPPLLIQPYVENAILHGLVSKNGNGELNLSFEKKNGALICKVEDNGIGRKQSAMLLEKKESKHKSLGIKVTNERMENLSTLLDYKTEVVIEDLYDEQQKAAGTRVTITIPVKEEE